MYLPMIILGATESDYTKIVFGVVFFLIWLASAATGAIAKRQQQQKRRQLETGMRPPQAPRPAPQSTPAAQRRVQPARTKVVKKPAPVTPPPLTSRAPELVGTTAPVTRTEISAPSPERATSKPRVSANSLNSWMRPSTLRQQFILTEIFQPPLSMREPRD